MSWPDSYTFYLYGRGSILPTGRAEPRPTDTDFSRTALLRGLEFALHRFLCRLDLRRLFLDETDEVVDHALILQPVRCHAAEIDLMCVVAAAREADIGLARLARTVDDTADDGQGQRRRDVGQLLLADADRLDDVEILPRAGWARDDRHAAPPEAERFEHVVADLDLLDRIGRPRDADP